MSVLEGEDFAFCYDYNHLITAGNKANITIILMVNRVFQVFQFRFQVHVQVVFSD